MALTLTRRQGEEIWIAGGSIRITFNQCSKGRTIVSIDAPRDIRIDRAECPQLLDVEAVQQQQAALAAHS